MAWTPLGYLPDSASPIVMVNIVTDHTQFTKEHAHTAATEQSGHYDPYDKSNDWAACLFLF